MNKSLSKLLLLSITTILLLVSGCDSPSPSSPNNSQEAFPELQQTFESKLNLLHFGGHPVKP